MEQGPAACGVPRPSWTAPLLASYLTEQTGIVVSERTVRRGLESLDYVCRRPTWTVRHKAEEQPDYLPKKAGVEALLSAGASTPSPPADGPVLPVLPTVRHEVVDPADEAAVRWLCDLLGAGRADLYGQDEADLGLLPTLTRTWMRRGEQLQVRAPGINEKCSVSCATDLAEGAPLWRTDDQRCADQFCATLTAAAERSTARGRLAVVMTDNARPHQVGKTGIVRRGLDGLAGRVVIVFQPAYSPDLQPVERVWRQWRPNVTHNHRRATLAALQEDSDGWFRRMAAEPAALLQALAIPACQPLKMAA
jgi:transposase